MGIRPSSVGLGIYEILKGDKGKNRRQKKEIRSVRESNVPRAEWASGPRPRADIPHSSRGTALLARGPNGHPARARGPFPIRPRPRADTSEPPVGWMLALLLTRWQGQGSPETMAMLSTGARGYACSRGQHRHGFRSNDKKTQALVGKYLNNSIGQSLRISCFGQ